MHLMLFSEVSASVQGIPTGDPGTTGTWQTPNSVWGGRILTVVVFAMKSARGTKTVKGPAPLSSLVFSACGREAFVGWQTENTVPVSKSLLQKIQVGIADREKLFVTNQYHLKEHGCVFDPCELLKQRERAGVSRVSSTSSQHSDLLLPLPLQQVLLTHHSHLALPPLPALWAWTTWRLQSRQ